MEPDAGHLLDTMNAMRERGIELVYGRWLIEGAPRALLINTSTGYKWLNEWKGDVWNAAGIPSPDADHETNEAITLLTEMIKTSAGQLGPDDQFI